MRCILELFIDSRDALGLVVRITRKHGDICGHVQYVDVVRRRLGKIIMRMRPVKNMSLTHLQQRLVCAGSKANSLCINCLNLCLNSINFDTIYFK